jgi:hypothetical protein
VAGPLRAILVCHCSECRRWTGRAWPATAARLADLALDETGELRWRASPRSEHGADRGFCARCGTCLFWRIAGSGTLSVSAGSLDDPTGLDVAAHIWCEHRLPWEPVPKGMPTYPRGYPAEAPELPWI